MTHFFYPLGLTHIVILVVELRQRKILFVFLGMAVMKYMQNVLCNVYGL